jgi:hypothetical protein
LIWFVKKLDGSKPPLDAEDADSIVTCLKINRSLKRKPSR